MIDWLEMSGVSKVAVSNGQANLFLYVFTAAEDRNNLGN